MNKFLLTFALLASAATISLNAQAAFWDKTSEKEVSEFDSLSPEEKTERILKANDSNDDEKLSKKEVDFVFRVKRFNKVDKNNDGYLDREELIESYEKADSYNKNKPQPASN
ncbi:MAG: hypothetical protein QNJ31_03425 [Candidatus Caenarcaniphilales bacterium]|nr:hypothetical protein [Candidatus Caenarcaniphilales bacterium]